MSEIENPYTKLEFLTGIRYGAENIRTEYVGIVVNHDNAILTFYDVEAIPGPEQKQSFLDYGEMWWWESNRQLPIDVFLHHEMKEFHPYLKTLAMKDVEVLFGPMTSMANLLKKRIKRRTVQLVRKTDTNNTER